MTFTVWAIVGAGAAAAPTPWSTRSPSDHRLPLRAGTCDADVDHGRHGTGAQAGVLIRNAEALEMLEQVDTLVVDKTGTLTEGKPSSSPSRRCAGCDESESSPARREPREARANIRWPLPIVAGAKRTRT